MKAGLALAALLALAGCAAPRPRAVDPALAAAGAVAAVQSGESVRCRATGGAVHLGGGRFVTAAHVVDGSVQLSRGVCPAGAGPLVLAVAGSPAPARLVRAGQDRIDRGIGQRYLGGEDVALLRPARALPRLGAAALCPALPPPGTPALLVTPRRSLRTRILAPVADPDARFGAYLEIPERLMPGESGGAVFEAGSGCLAGLVSHRDEGPGPARTRLVPAPVIARFLAAIVGP
ncbi:trypsin-like peptidase domain-containing protein [Falsiroseomonas selenitidurans]|uniref:Trypsin-like peptidase domain-containing protein n=1 Tax=Falsiroseomonas selenitidurans TaxID=2716335 RepID=A0ABX1E3M8_9PROT|nr:trypsin-like peptidase domain-containing protein [Falsiroseomonas selenitidurans]NKC31784.1 trypsin-like peptidase domain-containing protein [Falsiroseomonas selenitidurans]